MPHCSRKILPARSQGVNSSHTRITCPSRNVCFAEPSTSRTTANKQSVLNDDPDIEIPVRGNWWSYRGENSRDVMDVLEKRDIPDAYNVADEFDVESLRSESIIYSVDSLDGSDGESIKSIVNPQRKPFTQKENQDQKKLGHIIGNRGALAKPHRHRSGIKRKNIFADYIESESEDEIPDIQPKVFRFQKNMGQKRRKRSAWPEKVYSSISSIDLQMDDCNLRSSSSMVENQLEEAATTPVKRAKLRQLPEANKSETANANSTVNKTKQSKKSIISKKPSKSILKECNKELNIFNQASRPRTKPTFLGALQKISKTDNKTKEMPTAYVNRKFGLRTVIKRKSMFADYIESEREDEIPDIRPKVFRFQKNMGQKRRKRSAWPEKVYSSTSSIDLQMDDCKQLPVSSMVENQLEEAATTPVKRAKLRQLPEAKKLETANANSTVNKTKQSKKSIMSTKPSKSKLKEGNKTNEMPTANINRNFGHRPGIKRKNLFADSFVSESEDEISNIQPKVFGFQKNMGQKRRKRSASLVEVYFSTSSIDLQMDDCKQLPFSSMIENQLDETGTTPVKRVKLNQLSENSSKSKFNQDEQNEKTIDVVETIITVCGEESDSDQSELEESREAEEEIRTNQFLNSKSTVHEESVVAEGEERIDQSLNDKQNEAMNLMMWNA
ncbi:uncharacterized protein LOC126780265 [Nymphalis io]|uniref:uncharacterized protein LOC126780265 n=1 Tax=Inachis io TaxID=171585 RepID=UPI00216A8CE3|nr:uncharacterized protein LOC126780265 [Nymphalis io]XP_050360542.1 uncharacterized protein LOC126780265 [Nymphalis io]